METLLRIIINNNIDWGDLVDDGIFNAHFYNIRTKWFEET